MLYLKNFVLGCIIMVFTTCSYLPTNLPDYERIQIEESANYLSITSESTDTDKTGVIFYPGGLVDPHAYIQAFKTLVINDNRAVVIVKAPSNLAIINSQKASTLLDEINLANQWILGGHSLGGSVACIDLFNNPEKFKALFLLAAYSIEDLSNFDIPILSITASKDEVLDFQKFNDNKINLPEGLIISSPDEIPEFGTSGTTIYYDIVGGNHAQFGSYGNQSGDGDSNIDEATQQTHVAEAIRNFLISNNF